MGCFISPPPTDKPYEEMCQKAGQALTPLSQYNTNKSFFFKDSDGCVWKLHKHPCRKEAIDTFNNNKGVCRLPDTEYILKPLQVHMVGHKAIALKMAHGGKDLYDIMTADFEPYTVLQALTDISEAIHWLHGHGIAHRDVKPENIVLHKGRFKLIDFDFSCSLNEFKHCGTENYMCSPKVTDTWPGSTKEFSRRVDVYAFGKMVLASLCNAACNGYVKGYFCLRKMFRDDVVAASWQIAPDWQPWLDLAVACCGKIPPLSIPPLPTTMKNAIGTIDAETSGTPLQVVDADDIFA